MINWMEAHSLQIGLVICVAILLTVGEAKILPRVRSSRFLLWVALAVRLICGLILGYALYGVMGWLTSLGGIAGGTIGSIGAVLAVAAGWWSVDMLVAFVRDVADGVPDEDARKAALWFPTMAPAGLGAAWGIASNPRGLGTGITAVIIAAITVIYCHKIVKSALAARKGSKLWRWFAAAICMLSGLVLIPLVAFLDGHADGWLPDWVLLIVRLALGALALGLLIAALVDIVDKVPDAAVRAFLAYGVPLCFLFGAAALAAIGDSASSGGELILGGMR